MGRALDDLIDLLELEQLEVNLFRGVSPDEDRQRVFGGQVAGQALVAAGRTVDSDRRVHSLHVLPAPGRSPHPDRLRRRPHPRRAQLHDPARRRDPARARDLQPVGVVPHRRAGSRAPIPDAGRPGPDTLPTMRERLEPYADRFPPAFVEWIRRDRPIDTRSSRLPRWLDPDPSPREPEQLVWFRADGKLPDDPLLHACIVAYASDLTLLDTAVMSHAHSWDDDRFMIASLDHAMWFHRPLRADEWLLYHQKSPSAQGARGLAEGFIFRHDGALAVTVIQEGLMRPVKPGWQES